MKKSIILFAFVTTIHTITLAQVKNDNSVHLTFKGVPIDGTLDEYVSKMEQNGFVQTGTNDGLSNLEGDFASYKNCTLGVSTLKNNDLVNKIVVSFPALTNWSSLSSNYFNLKELLTEKYGKPSLVKEEFQNFIPKDDGTKMNLVQLGACKFVSIFKTDKGSIELTIEHSETMSCFVKLAYFDKINGETIKKEALNDL